MTVHREDFEENTRDLLERTLFTTRQALQASGLLWKDIDRVLLVGGSSRLPMVRRAVAELSGIAPDTTINPDEAVARGAAIFSRHLLGSLGREADVPRLAITDVNAHSLGIEGVNLGTLRTENVCVIPKNTPLPHSVTRTFITKEDNQRSVKIQLLEGESSVVEQCSPLAAATIRHLPPGLPSGTQIKVTYTFQSNGRLAASANIEGLGRDAYIELERVRDVPSENVDRWRKVICRDGGYSSFREALDDLCADYVMQGDTHQEPAAADTVDDKAETPRKKTLKPAVEFGAPLAASKTLTNYFLASSPDEGHPDDVEANHVRKGIAVVHGARVRNYTTFRSLLYYAVAYLTSAVIGIAAGYYALSWVRPDLNFLKLDLPGVSSQQE